MKCTAKSDKINNVFRRQIKLESSALETIALLSDRLVGRELAEIRKTTIWNILMRIVELQKGIDKLRSDGELRKPSYPEHDGNLDYDVIVQLMKENERNLAKLKESVEKIENEYSQTVKY